MPAYRSRTTTHGRNMAGARGLWRATGMKDEAGIVWVPGCDRRRETGEPGLRDRDLEVQDQEVPGAGPAPAPGVAPPRAL